MALPISVTYTFATATSAIPLSQLDANFTTCVNGINGIGNGTNALSNVSITGGNATVTTVNATTLNAATHRSDTTLTFQSNVSTTAMTINTSQNVGIGTASPTSKLHVVGGRTDLAAASETYALGVRYSSGTGIYYIGATNSATPDLVFSQTGGTERMRVTNAGDVGIGTSAPTAALHVNSASSPQIKFGGSSAAYYWALDREASAGDFQISNANGGAATVRMTLATSGNVGIGTTSPAANLQINSVDGTNTIFRSTSGANNGRLNVDVSDAAGTVGFSTGGNSTFPAITFATSSTERMRIDSSGNLLVGITTSDARLNVKGSGTGSGTYTTKMANSAGTIGLQIRDDGYVGSPMIYAVTNANSPNLVITSDGYIYRSTSSLKYKRDVEDATHGLAEVMQLRSVTYKGKAKSDNEKILGGLIAEEVHAAGLTEFVQYAEDGSPDALAYGNMVSLCIKAIQELKAQNDALTARVAALEAK